MRAGLILRQGGPEFGPFYGALEANLKGKIFFLVRRLWSFMEKLS
jgi:hypothetical protein